MKPIYLFTAGLSLEFGERLAISESSLAETGFIKLRGTHVW